MGINIKLSGPYHHRGNKTCHLKLKKNRKSITVEFVGSVQQTVPDPEFLPCLFLDFEEIFGWVNAKHL